MQNNFIAKIHTTNWIILIYHDHYSDLFMYALRSHASAIFQNQNPID